MRLKSRISLRRAAVDILICNSSLTSSNRRAASCLRSFAWTAESSVEGRESEAMDVSRRLEVFEGLWREVEVGEVTLMSLELSAGVGRNGEVVVDD